MSSEIPCLAAPHLETRDVSAITVYYTTSERKRQHKFLLNMSEFFQLVFTNRPNIRRLFLRVLSQPNSGVRLSGELRDMLAEGFGLRLSVDDADFEPRTQLFKGGDRAHLAANLIV